MKKIITYGTFDLLHYGHIRLLERAKQLGDYLVVGITSENYDRERGKLNVHDSLYERIENVKKTGLADEILVEEFEGQKILDIQKKEIDTFVIGSDWIGKFDYLKEYCEVVYLERTKDVSSTELRVSSNGILRMGIIGSGRIAKRFVKESKYVSGINVEGVFNIHLDSAKRFAEEEELAFFTDNLEDFYQKVDAVYIASPHQTHYDYIMNSLKARKHVLCEKPMTLSEKDAVNAYNYAREKHLVLMHAIKTAYCPAFEHLIVLAKSGRIGKIRDVEASFTKLTKDNLRETTFETAGGSINELVTYPLLPIFELLGSDYKKVEFYSTMKNNVDMFTKGIILYPNATASFKVGLGAKTEGNLIITGTEGYIYVPAPWWKTDYFEMRFENADDNRKYFYCFEGDGLRYEIVEFLRLITNEIFESPKLPSKETIQMCKVIEEFTQKRNIIE